MAFTYEDDRLIQGIRDFVLEGFHPQYGQLLQRFDSNPLWERLGTLGTNLWLDTGNMDDAHDIWTCEFHALTTNNTLLNKEVQRGAYDDLIFRAAKMLLQFGQLSWQDMRLEIGFILNAYHALRLVERFDAFVSVEEHTDLAHDVQATVAYGVRYHSICPDRFIIKVPFTPAGVLASRLLARAGVPVNHTLGFSARQNYVVARIAMPQFVNVFLGRLNAFVSDNNLGDGMYVGERATNASQLAIRQLRSQRRIPTRQIAASMRNGQQVVDLAGVDVMTMPPKAAREFIGMGLQPEDLTDRMTEEYHPQFNADVDPRAIRLDTLWDIPRELCDCLDALEQEHLDRFTPDDLIDFFARHGFGDIFVRWTEPQRSMSRSEGKIPKMANWSEALASGTIGLDSLMNLAGFNSFAADQAAMDERIEGVLRKGQYCPEELKEKAKTQSGD